MRSDGIEAVGARRYRNGQAQFQLETVAFKTWWGQANMVVEICPPDWNRVNLSGKNLVGTSPHVPIHTGAPVPGRAGRVYSSMPLILLSK